MHVCMYKYGKLAKAVIYKDPNSISLYTKPLKARPFLTLALIIFYYCSGWVFWCLHADKSCAATLGSISLHVPEQPGMYKLQNHSANNPWWPRAVTQPAQDLLKQVQNMEIRSKEPLEEDKFKELASIFKLL